MANTIPCPNPVCTHAFGLAELQATAQLVCPKCGFRLKGKGPAKPEPRGKADKTLPPGFVAPPAAVKPPHVQPAAAPVVLANPVPSPASAAPMLATPISTPTVAPPPAGDQSVPEGSFFNPGADSAGPILRVNRKKKSFSWKKLLLVLFVVGIASSMVVLGVGFIFFFMMGGGTGAGYGGAAAATPEGTTFKGKIRNAKNEEEQIYKLVLNKNDWAVDGDIKRAFNAHAAWRLREQDFWFAVVVNDYGMAKPRDAEMLRFCIEKLDGYFGESTELAAKAEPTKVGDLSAQKLDFKGQMKAAVWNGECIMCFKDGIGYWLFLASPDLETVRTMAAEVPKSNFFVATERRGWREQPPAVDTLVSISGRLALTAPKGAWEKHDARNEDEQGDLLLFGRYKKEQNNAKNALVLVFTLEKQANLHDAMKTAREHLTKKLTGGEGNTSKLIPLNETADGKEASAGPIEDVGNRRGLMMDLKLQFNDEPKRYYLLAVVNEPDQAFAIQCECSWDSRQIWRQEFLELLRTLNVRKGE